MYLKMKQRTRLMHGDELMGYTMNAKKEEGIDSAEIPLHKMKTQDHFIEAQIQEGDTLQAIALRFYCSISELKRINQIHKDNEIFARRTIKVPVTPYSVLTERLPASLDNVPSTSKNTLSSNYLVNNHTGLLQTSINQCEDKEINANNDFAIDCNAIVLNSTLAPSVVPYTDVEPVESVSEDTQLLPSKPRESVETVVVKELTSHGADFGLKWYHLLFCVLLLGLIPLVYIFRNVHIVTHNVIVPHKMVNELTVNKTLAPNSPP